MRAEWLPKSVAHGDAENGARVVAPGREALRKEGVGVNDFDLRVAGCDVSTRSIETLIRLLAVPTK